MEVVFLLAIAFFASVIGSICGVGGGVFMKPVLDMFSLVSVSTASFLSAMTVLAMTSYTTAKNLMSKNRVIAVHEVAPLALGAAMGGVAGKYLFEQIKELLPYADKIGAVQAVFLGVVALGALVYTLSKSRIRTRHVQSQAASVLIGLCLGIMSSFLGIGGGPIDLIVLLYFFSMDTKKAVQNSLFVILFSQAFSLVYMLLSGTVPEFEPLALIFMIIGGIVGGMCGRGISAKISNSTTDKLFIGLLALIVLISVYNFCKY